VRSSHCNSPAGVVSSPLANPVMLLIIRSLSVRLRRPTMLRFVK
jgi:hypothetical protein